MKLSTIFSGNDSRIYDLLFDDVTRDNTDNTITGDLIDSHIKKVFESKRIKLILSFEQKSLLTKLHTYSFNVRLGMKVTYTSSTSSTTHLKSLALMKVCSKFPYFQVSICLHTTLNFILNLNMCRTLVRTLYKEQILL